MNKVIFIKDLIKAFIVLLVNHFGLKRNWWMVNVLIVVEMFMKWKKKLIF